MDTRTPSRGLIALENGVATIDLSHLLCVEVEGADAVAWVDALVTSGVSTLAPGETQRSLLLTPTGRIRADITVVRTGEGLILLQDPAQPEPIDDALEPYVLSAEVSLARRSVALFQVPRDPGIPGTLWSARPGPVSRGVVIAFPLDERERVAAALADTFVPAERDDLECFRIRAGFARFPDDLLPTSIPAEAGLDRIVVDASKGCFLGQESVAKVRNLGHPSHVVLHLWLDKDAVSGNPVFEGGERVGSVTSVCPTDAGCHVMARLRWKAEEEPRHLSDGRGHLYRIIHTTPVRPPR